MEVLGRYRNLAVLVGVLFAQVLGLAVQVSVKRAGESEPTRLIRVWTVSAVTPFEELLDWAQNSARGVWRNYVFLRGVRAENRGLKAQIEQMRIEQVRMIQDADQARRLQALLGFKEQFISRTVAAQVVGGSGSELSRSVFIDKGDNDGVRPDMAVITADGIVGKVLHVYGSTSEVLRIDDQSSGVGAILDKSRLQGILNGTASGELTLSRVMSDENVPEGELLLTSGGDGIFPKGLPVGRVTRVSRGSDLFLNIHVQPAANLNKLEEVLVVTKIDERQTQPDRAGTQRAVDILAERLPSVPSKTESGAGDGAKNPADGGQTTEASSPAAVSGDARPKPKGPPGLAAGAPERNGPRTAMQAASANPHAPSSSTAGSGSAANATKIATKPLKAAAARSDPAIGDGPR